MSARKTTEQFIAEMKESFPDSDYNYSKVVYEANTKKVTIICNKHNHTFEKTPNRMLNTKVACPLCNKEKKKKMTSEDFLQFATEKFGDMFDYSKVEFTVKSREVIIICPTHGEVSLTPSRHLQSNTGCPLCTGNTKKDTEQFRVEASSIYPQYDYSEAEYVNCRTPVKVICPDHGPFYINPKEHTGSKRHKCFKCSWREVNERKALSGEQWIEKVLIERPEFVDWFDYSFVNYTNDRTLVKIRCKKHDNIFEVQPRLHLTNVYGGCSQCLEDYQVQYRNTRLVVPLTTEEWIKKSISRYGEGFFDYSKVNHTKSVNDVELRCVKHDYWFKTQAGRHLYGSVKFGGCDLCFEENRSIANLHTSETLQQMADEKYGEGKYNLSSIGKYSGMNGQYDINCLSCGEIYHTTLSNFLYTGAECPCQREKCNRSTYERITKSILENLEIHFTEQKRFEACRHRRSLAFDFYLPELNILIEVQGEGHYRPVNFGGISDEEAQKNFEVGQIRDQIKRDFCKKYDIKEVEIPYWEYENDTAEDFIKNALKG